MNLKACLDIQLLLNYDRSYECILIIIFNYEYKKETMFKKITLDLQRISKRKVSTRNGKNIQSNINSLLKKT